MKEFQYRGTGFKPNDMKKLELVIEKVAETMKKVIDGGEAGSVVKKAMILTLQERGFTRLQAEVITVKAYGKLAA